MMIARWTIDARFGRKQAALALMRQWWSDIAPRIGWSRDRARLLTGSLGAAESTIQVEVEIADLAQLDDAWAKLASVPEQETWAAALEPLVVSGTATWSVYRLVPAGGAPGDAQPGIARVPLRPVDDRESRA